MTDRPSAPPRVSALDRALEHFRKFFQYLWLQTLGPSLNETRLCWAIDRIAVGPCIHTAEDAAFLRGNGVSHIINLQESIDYRAGAESVGLVVYDAPTGDDLSYKPPETFTGAVEFALAALQHPRAKLYVHCTAGVHRGPMITLAILAALGYPIPDAMELIRWARPQARFPEVYRRSVEDWLAVWRRSRRQ